MGQAAFELAANKPRGAGKAAAGPATLKRAALANTLVRGTGEEAWRGILAHLARQLRAELVDYPRPGPRLTRSSPKACIVRRARKRDAFGQSGTRISWPLAAAFSPNEVLAITQFELTQTQMRPPESAIMKSFS